MSNLENPKIEYVDDYNMMWEFNVGGNQYGVFSRKDGKHMLVLKNYKEAAKYSVMTVYDTVALTVFHPGTRIPLYDENIDMYKLDSKR